MDTSCDWRLAVKPHQMFQTSYAKKGIGAGNSEKIVQKYSRWQNGGVLFRMWLDGACHGDVGLLHKAAVVFVMSSSVKNICRTKHYC